MGKPAGGATYMWKCRCDCGGEKITKLTYLTNGETKSCGCLVVEKASTMTKTHGLTGSPEHIAWKRMRSRILNPENKDYAAYGGAGLMIEPSWADFSVFLAHIGPKPADGKRYSVDRKDNTKGYVIGNVRWATDKQQARNKGIYKTNSTGTSGVTWTVNSKNQCLYAKATCRHPDTGAVEAKCFSAVKYGLIPSLSMAISWRRAMLHSLTFAGAGYTTAHGK